MPLGTVKSRLYYATRLLRASIEAAGRATQLRTDAGMTTPRDPDLILGAWLDENAVPLPASTQRAIDIAIQEDPQRRRSTWLPRRPERMSIILRFGMAAAAVLIVAVGAAALLRPTADPGVGASPPPTVSSSPSPDPSTWSTFTSERYGFEVRYPAGLRRLSGAGRYQPGVGQRRPGRVRPDHRRCRLLRPLFVEHAPRGRDDAGTVDRGVRVPLRAGCDLGVADGRRPACARSG